MALHSVNFGFSIICLSDFKFGLPWFLSHMPTGVQDKKQRKLNFKSHFVKITLSQFQPHVPIGELQIILVSTPACVTHNTKTRVQYDMCMLINTLFADSKCLQCL